MSKDIAKLVREAREQVVVRAPDGQVVGRILNAGLILALCDALEEREREVERLREALEHIAQQTEARRLEHYPPSFIVSLNSVARHGLAAREREERDG